MKLELNNISYNILSLSIVHSNSGNLGIINFSVLLDFLLFVSPTKMYLLLPLIVDSSNISV